MYKCTECGMEYQVKPDYCDCGNDEFVLTIEKTSEPVVDIQQDEPIQAEKQEKIIENLEKSYNAENSAQQSNEVKTKLQYMPPVSPISICIFILCIVISFLIIFVWNPKSAESEAINSEQNDKPAIKQNIPSIDKLWKDPDVQQIVQTPAPVKTVTPPATVKKVQQTTSVKKQQQKKTTTAPATKKTTTQKTVTQKPAEQKQTVQQQPSAQEIEAQKAAEAAKKAAEAKQKAEAEAKVAAERARQSAVAKQEYANYKIALRNTIGKKIDFTKVIGDGSCVVSFKIDSTGKLINRAFAQQSNNLTLNNAVYKAVMATPDFTKPPSAYKNETLRLNIRFNNGNFAITLE